MILNKRYLHLLPLVGNGFALTLSPLGPPTLRRQRCFLNASPAASIPDPNNIKTTTSVLSAAAQWHRERRKQMMAKYKQEIAPLEQKSSQHVAAPLLLLANMGLLILSLLSGSLPLPLVFLLAVFPGSIFSLWQLQILHDVLHGSFLNDKYRKYQDGLLFWGSMPSIFGYYLYLKYGHLTHHKSVGDAEKISLKQLFSSSQKTFEDGDVLFVAHRMKLKGDIGPKFTFGNKEVKMSISKSGFDQWKVGHPVRNAAVFAMSFLFERFMLMTNDVVVSLTGRNFFFPNKPNTFHQECAKYCRCACLVRALLWAVAGWKSLFFLYLSETLWSLPPHPAAAMFVTNHGSKMTQKGECTPSSSTYAGRWYSLFTLGTNYHVEHHDFPTIPFHKLGELRKIAPEYYQRSSNDNPWRIMRKVFSEPEYYACMDVGVGGVLPSVA